MVLILIGTSCNTTNYVKGNQSLLKKNKFKMVEFDSDLTENQLSADIFTLYRQRPNRKVLVGIPREWFYYNLSKLDPTKMRYKIFSNYAEEPAILDSILVKSTENNIRNYFINKGYLNVTVSSTIKTKRKKSTVTYLIYAKDRLKIRSIEYSTLDTAILEILNSNASTALLKKGSPVDNALFQAEKARITDILNNNGFADFTPLYIPSLKIDTSDNLADLILRVNLPQGKSKHDQFRIGKVNVIRQSADAVAYDKVETEFDSIKFIRYGGGVEVKNSLLARNIFTRPGQLYNKSNLSKSTSQLNRLGLFRFINLDTKKDSSKPGNIDISYTLNLNKRWVFDASSDLNYTTVRALGSNLFGISGNVNLRNRNLLGSAEVLSTSLEVGTEVNITKLSTYNAINLRYQNSLRLADFYDITGGFAIWKSIVKRFGRTVQKPNSFTSLELGFNYVFLNDAYIYYLLNTQVAYDIRLDRYKRIDAHTFSISLYVPVTFPRFDSVIKKNSFLESSFKGKRLITSFLFHDFIKYKQKDLNERWTTSNYYSVEFSGIEISAINSLYNLILAKDEVFSLNSLQFSKFIKLDWDKRWYYTMKDRSSVAFRLTSGVAIPYGRDKVVPYIRKFFMGGPQSMRGWAIRELGPGATKPSQEQNEFAFFSAGDIKLEANAEYRTDLFWRFKWAWFFDIGNVWLWPQSEGTPEAKFSKDFINQIAFNTGVGLRMDISFCILRLDYGVKLRNSYLNADQSHWVFSKSNKLSLANIWNEGNFHLAINYPF